MGVVREDVVKMGFDIDFAELTRLTSALDDIKTILTTGIGGDAFDEMTKESKQAAKGIDDIKDGINGIKPKGLNDTVNGLRETDEEADDAYKKLKKICDAKFNKTVSGLKSVTTQLKNVGIQAGKMLATGIAAGVAGVGALVAQSITSYAAYEQLTGGVDTLFNDSSGTVQKYADDAWKTAGMSANNYMETVTSFSASLIQSLGGNTGAAAELANQAIIDMADNANKMGSDLSSIEEAYMSFSRGQYQLLDNLKLGYGGTQEEMKRLLSDAQAISGVAYDISSYADVVEAIHVIQDSMGISGTTAKEASETIAGSAASMKAAWGNTLTSLVLGGDDLDRNIDNLVTSFTTFAKNLMPALVSALGGLGSLIEELCPLIEENMPVIVETLLPPLIQAATALLKGLIVAMPDIISTLVGELPGILTQVWEGISEAFGDVPGIEKVGTFFESLKSLITENTDLIQQLIPVVVGLVVALKAFNAVKGISGIFGGSGGSGGAGGGFFSSLAKTNTGTVLKGLANLAIIVGGLAALAAVLMWAAPYMAQLSDAKSTTEVLIVITAVGLLGTAMTKLAASVGNIPVATVTKGVANIAIALVGFGALAAVLMWLAPSIAQLSDITTFAKVLVIIGATGLVGTALAGLAGLVGAIPIATVLAGLANIALALGGFTAIVEAFGALTLIPGFSDFLTKGGEVLTQICGILGEMVGSVIGGIGEGITNSLPDIATNISTFATNIESGITTMSGLDFDGLSSFAGAFGAFMLVMAGEEILNWFTGGIDYASLGTNLSDMATNLSTFFGTVSSFGEGSFTKATALFECLAGISSLPQDGGVVGWFQGEVDFAKMAAGLNLLAGTAPFFTAIQSIPEEAFTKATQLFDCLAGIKALPQDGGVVGWFQGEVNFDSIASGIQSLASEGMISALTTISSIPAASFTTLSTMFETLAGIKAMPKEGGVAGWFTGDNSTALTNVSNQLPGVATAIAQFFTNLGGITDFTPITSLFEVLAGVKAMPEEGGIAGWFTGDSTTGLTNVSSKLPTVATHIASFFANLGGRTDFTPIKTLFDTLSNIKIDSDAAERGFLGLGKSDLETMGSGLSAFATNASTFFTKINSLKADNITAFFDALGTAGDLPDTLSALDSNVGTVLSNLVTTAETKLSELYMSFSDNLGDIYSLVTLTAGLMYNSGVDMMDGLNSGMESMRATLCATAASIASAVQAAYDVALDINSPSKVMMASGEDTVMGSVVGMRNTIPEVRSAATDVAAASVPVYSRVYTPETDSSTIYNNRTSSEYTEVAPVFNLTVSGTQDDRATARKVKQWVAQAIQDTFDSLERKSTVLREV